MSIYTQTKTGHNMDVIRIKQFSHLVDNQKHTTYVQMTTSKLF